MTSTITLSPVQLGKFIFALTVDPDAIGELCERSAYERFVAALAEVVAEHTGVSVVTTDDGNITFTAEPEIDITETGIGRWSAVKDAQVIAVTGRVHGDDDDSLFVFNDATGTNHSTLACRQLQAEAEISDEDLADEANEKASIYVINYEPIPDAMLANITALRSLDADRKL